MDKFELTHVLSAMFLVSFERKVIHKWWQFWKKDYILSGMESVRKSVMVTDYEARRLASDENLLKSRLVSVGNVGIDNISYSQLECLSTPVQYVRTRGHHADN